MRLYFCRAVVPCIFNILLYPNLMANDINNFVDNMDLKISNSFTHMLDTENSDELNVMYDVLHTLLMIYCFSLWKIANTV